MERRKGPLIGGVHARVVLDQQGGNVHMLDAGGEVEVKAKKEGGKVEMTDRR